MKMFSDTLGLLYVILVHVYSYIVLCVYTGYCLYVSTVWLPTIQGYQKVPETPLASCQVLRDEAEVWMDVQVGLLHTLRTK